MWDQFIKYLQKKSFPKLPPIKFQQKDRTIREQFYDLEKSKLLESFDDLEPGQKWNEYIKLRTELERRIKKK